MYPYNYPHRVGFLSRFRREQIFPKLQKSEVVYA